MYVLQIPLFGYGGCSEVMLSALDGRNVMNGEKHSLDMGPTSTSTHKHTVTLRNTGDRPAYWMAVCYQGKHTVTLRNTGDRPAYWMAVCYQGNLHYNTYILLRESTYCSRQNFAVVFRHNKVIITFTFVVKIWRRMIECDDLGATCTHTNAHCRDLSTKTGKCYSF